MSDPPRQLAHLAIPTTVAKIHTQRRAGSETLGAACVLQQKFAGERTNTLLRWSTLPA